MRQSSHHTEIRSMGVWLNARRCLAATVVIAIFILSGCGGKAQQWMGRLRTPEAGQISEEELWQELDMAEQLAARMLREISEIQETTTANDRTRRASLVRNIRVTQAVSTVLRHEDPVIAFLELWGLSVRLTNFFEAGEGSTAYGEHRDMVIGYARRYEAELERIGRMFLKGEEFLEAHTEIRRFAGQNPIRETFSNLLVYVTETRPGQPTPFGNIMAIPMAPFTALQGMDRTAAAIHGVRGSMDRFTDVVDGLPESTKWQLMLLLMDAEDTNIVRTLMAAVTALSTSSSELVTTAQQFPETLREQASVLVEDIDSRQDNIQATLEKTEQVAAALEQNLATAATTIDIAGQTAQTINEAAGEWESAVGATAELIRFLEQWRRDTPAKDPNAPTTAQGYEAMAQGITDAAGELQILLAEARDLLDSGVLATHVEDVDGRAGDLIDRVFWRLIQLVVAIAIVVVACRFASLRLGAKRPP